MVTMRRKSLRKKLAIGGVIFFLGATLLSIFLMFAGGGTISGENISISVNGPIAVGGGDELSYQVSVANQNTVPIQSATLIIEYPRGAKEIESGKDLTTERMQLDVVDTGELINVPLKVRMFGEENEEKEIKVSIDYRISGSNATFHKEATPLRFKVSTSPVIMTFDSLKAVSSGQEFELTLTVQSNSPTALSDLLVKMSYPGGFDFGGAEPETSSGEDVWKIATLKPTEKRTIKIKGLITGYEDETRKFSAQIGVPGTTNSNTLASTLSQANTEIVIERPFVNIGISINGVSDDTVVVDTRDIALVEMKFENSLDTTIYDGKVVVKLSGNALNEFDVRSTDGFYDSSSNTITWDAVDTEILKEIAPGEKSTINFSIDPYDNIGKTPEIGMEVSVRGKRVFEESVPEELIGTTERTIKLESIPMLSASAFHTSGPFENTGPIPPVAEKTTEYTLTLTVQAGANDVTGAEVTAILPQYMRWQGKVTEGDNVSYNATSRTVKWTIGNMDSNSEAEVSIQVGFLPSLTQVGTTPTILEAQRFKATDRFTDTIVRAENPSLTTALYNEQDTKYRDGRVRAGE